MARSSTSGIGRPKGVPNKATAEIKALAQSYGPAAIKRLAELAGFVKDKEPAVSEVAQIAATKELLDRAYGKSAQPQVGADGESNPISEIIYRWASAEPE